MAPRRRSQKALDELFQLCECLLQDESESTRHDDVILALRRLEHLLGQPSHGTEEPLPPPPAFLFHVVPAEADGESVCAADVLIDALVARLRIQGATDTPPGADLHALAWEVLSRLLLQLSRETGPNHQSTAYTLSAQWIPVSIRHALCTGAYLPATAVERLYEALILAAPGHTTWGDTCTAAAKALACGALDTPPLLVRRIPDAVTAMARGLECAAREQPTRAQAADRLRMETRRRLRAALEHLAPDDAATSARRDAIVTAIRQLERQLEQRLGATVDTAGSSTVAAVATLRTPLRRTDAVPVFAHSDTAPSTSRTTLAALERALQVLNARPARDWDDRVSALRTLTDVSAQLSPAELATILRPSTLRHSLPEQIQDLRSQVAREACHTCSVLARRLGDAFAEVLGVGAVGALLRVCIVTVAVIADSGKEALRCIARSSRFGRATPHLLEGIQAKQALPMRSFIAELLPELVDAQPAGDLDKYATEYTRALCSGLDDAAASVRARTRTAYWRYYRHVWRRAEADAEAAMHAVQRLERQVVERVSAASQRALLEEMPSDLRAARCAGDGEKRAERRVGVRQAPPFPTTTTFEARENVPPSPAQSEAVSRVAPATPGKTATTATTATTTTTNAAPGPRALGLGRQAWRALEPPPPRAGPVTLPAGFRLERAERVAEPTTLITSVAAAVRACTRANSWEARVTALNALRTALSQRMRLSPDEVLSAYEAVHRRLADAHLSVFKEASVALTALLAATGSGGIDAEDALAALEAYPAVARWLLRRPAPLAVDGDEQRPPLQLLLLLPPPLQALAAAPLPTDRLMRMLLRLTELEARAHLPEGVNPRVAVRTLELLQLLFVQVQPQRFQEWMQGDERGQVALVRRLLHLQGGSSQKYFEVRRAAERLWAAYVERVPEAVLQRVLARSSPGAWKAAARTTHPKVGAALHALSKYDDEVEVMRDARGEIAAWPPVPSLPWTPAGEVRNAGAAGADDALTEAWCSPVLPIARRLRFAMELPVVDGETITGAMRPLETLLARRMRCGQAGATSVSLEELQRWARWTQAHVADAPVVVTAAMRTLSRLMRRLPEYHRMAGAMLLLQLWTQALPHLPCADPPSSAARLLWQAAVERAGVQAAALIAATAAADAVEALPPPLDDLLGGLPTYPVQAAPLCWSALRAYVAALPPGRQASAARIVLTDTRLRRYLGACLLGDTASAARHHTVAFLVELISRSSPSSLCTQSPMPPLPPALDYLVRFRVRRCTAPVPQP
ncbi:hypothetical protein CDCA_CDCA17G4314 [Cyanidium caldarium]|uniref:TOG domain-containing protein n=1 Tax=Cyanidium caldarium TaxID=2771 RepID=A0AAV9J1A8_CYACA|nr:hypothetical protein CDCA_CDCA17G4314 [Cyanidium caldarium]